MVKPESIILKEVALEASRLGLRVFRNETGFFVGWDVVKIALSYLLKGNVSGCISYLKKLRPIRCGLCVGSSDLIGWCPRGRFVAIEVKAGRGRLSKEQENFINQVCKSGGIGLVCADAKNLQKQLDAFGL
jgi:hypothetical protein